MSQVASETLTKKRIHPFKFAMWLAIGSIIMMFAGLTSGFLVREAQGNWRTYEMPIEFWISTFVIILSSITLHFGIKSFKHQNFATAKKLVLATLILGIAFCALQYTGFKTLYATPQLEQYGDITGEMRTVRVDGNPSESFLFVIAGLHLLHILGGIIAMIIVYFTTFRKKNISIKTTGIEVVSIYWHFVDILWIYLFIFFLFNL